MAPLEFRLPDVGEGIATAEIVAWQVAEGDQVTEHQDLVEIQTDKATVVIPCPANGVITRLCGTPGDTLDVGAVLAVIEADGAAAAPVAPANGAGEPAARATAGAGAPARAGAPLAAPTTRRLARELGVALEDVAGSGPHGRIVREDVERAAAGSAASAAPKATAPTPSPMPSRAAPTPGEVVPLRGVRRTIAHALTRAWLEVPRIIDYREVDATALLRARASLRQRAIARGDKALGRALTPTPLIVRAAVLAARDHPYVNASIDLEREEITLHRHYHVGIATAGPDGLTVPVVHDADHRSLAEIALEVVELARAARERRLRPDQLAGPTFTVNNFGSLGTWMGTPIVRPPEVVNLGVGGIRDRVVAVDGAAVVRPTLVLCVAGDHRVLDGDTLAAYVNQVAELLEDPVLLFEDLR
ncbi:MAG TPA: dihydrolipoamide acetyltransferase family protein [Solirubrobacteraceae bacterium]|nr:dihydrolipoamide acetyltransferase family protein [Solirubrobacteraceae bacterium]